MKPLSQMTRDELWSAPLEDIVELAIQHDITIPNIADSAIGTWLMYFGTAELDKLRLELQQDNADSRQDR